MAFNYPMESQAILSAIENIGSQLAAVIVTHNPKTVAEIKSDYATGASAGSDASQKKVRILLVPGHEPDFGGAEFGSLKERNMTVELATDLQSFLGQNPRYQVFVTRDRTAWSPTFADYFKNDWNDIIAWEAAHKDEVDGLTRLGQFQPVAPDVFHNSAPTNVALRLYGIDKWADENGMDIVLHIHFNDYPGHPRGTAGKYSGFTIYVPQKEYGNSSTTKALADTVFDRLKKYNAVSDLPGESSGIVEDQDLIAIGAYNSVDAASMLVEYGYIYEPQFVNPGLRSQTIKDLAFQTYLGLQDFFDPHSAVNLAGSFDTLVMPHIWAGPLSGTSASSSEVFALQTALLLDGDYPPSDKSKNDCPRTGTLGSCTKAALYVFQKKYRIVGEEGVVGAKTVQELNKLYGVKTI